MNEDLKKAMEAEERKPLELVPMQRASDAARVAEWAERNPPRPRARRSIVRRIARALGL